LLTPNKEYHVSTILNNSGNTDFIKNFKNLELENFFKENESENKVIFAKKYVETAQIEDKESKLIPKWVEEIKKYFR